MASNLDKQLNNNVVWLSTFALIGLSLSMYGLYVEIQFEKQPRYKALCDISETISCSKAFKSKFGKGLGFIPEGSPFYLPNPFYGLFSYTTLFLLINFCGTSRVIVSIILLSSLIFNFLTIYLAYILYKLKTFCVVCVSLYVVNFFLLIFSNQRRKIVSHMRRKTPKKD